ncbi:hypothetical protein [Pseudomonas mosselii]|uniref:hypothetical protein n=1 Tax=Pseudomonas mosselii TaxID=78327 RepID=UPI0021DA0BA3|nr:hypothetical protein [Pseudomonas mosselii]MCU9527502.1 hypothetical protein [Pseudomonas mosselii]MCU9534815.1 hypothetical protein [Pseudomonas mosselii]MCU9542749.1 hypothetical protein [Pseudomonas mosselii]MCU9546655.1 hypothetical protein [Pseudomonas mosselii]
MTTITWDLKTLSADTLISDSAGMAKTGFITERGWTVKTKLRVPVEHVTYERSPIIAVGASGSVFVGRMIADFLLDHDLEPGTRPSTLLEENLSAHTTAVLAAHPQDASLLILTESQCWRLKAVPGMPVDITNVTSCPTAIGAGALYAQPCLDAGQSGVESIIEAARHPASETNFSIEYVALSPKPVVKRAWQSYTTLRDPLRLNRVTTRCIAVIGGLLTAAGGVALQAGSFTGISEMLWVVLTMIGLVATVSSVLTSLSETRGLAYHLIPIGMMVLLLSWDESERFLEAYNLPPPFPALHRHGIGSGRTTRNMALRNAPAECCACRGRLVFGELAGGGNRV